LFRPRAEELFASALREHQPDKSVPRPLQRRAHSPPAIIRVAAAFLADGLSSDSAMNSRMRRLSSNPYALCQSLQRPFADTGRNCNRSTFSKMKPDHLPARLARSANGRASRWQVHRSQENRRVKSILSAGRRPVLNRARGKLHLSERPVMVRRSHGDRLRRPVVVWRVLRSAQDPLLWEFATIPRRRDRFGRGAPRPS